VDNGVPSDAPASLRTRAIISLCVCALWPTGVTPAAHGFVCQPPQASVKYDLTSVPDATVTSK
jgi:hypothetical protein